MAFLFKFTGKDWAALGAITAAGGLAAAGAFLGKTSVYYYPKIKLPEMDPLMAVCLAGFVVLMILPLIIDILGERKWQQLSLEE